MKHRNKFRLGEKVFFHAKANPQNENTLLLCKGIVIRVPYGNINSYKVAIVEVCEYSLATSSKLSLATTLLGKKINRKESQLNSSLSPLMEAAYKNTGHWLSVNENDLRKIKNSMR